MIAPGTTQLTAKDLEFRANKSNAACIITTPAIAGTFDQVADKCPTVKTKIVITEPKDGWVFLDDAMAQASEDLRPQKPKRMTTAWSISPPAPPGFPKWPCIPTLTHTATMVTGKYWLDLKPEDMHWNVSDTGWAKAAWSSYFGPWNQGAAQFIHHTDRFDPKITLELLSKYPVTTMCGAPTIYRMLVLQDLSKYKFPTLRHCVGAGEPLNPEIIEVWKKATGCTIRDGYGQTETVLLAGNFPASSPGSVPWANPPRALTCMSSMTRAIF
jgi:acyl-coenzyme A synthetase/AMP-(fatty) acid ligase